VWEPDEGTLCARHDELTAPGLRSVHPATRASTERLLRQFNGRDWGSWAASFANDFVGRDLRVHAGTENRGPAETVELFKNIVAVMPNVQMSSDILVGEVLADGTQITGRINTFADGGHAEVRTGNVTVMRDGKALRVDILEEDVEGVLAHYDATREALLGEA
jgi:hypothetical protein